MKPRTRCDMLGVCQGGAGCSGCAARPCYPFAPGAVVRMPRRSLGARLGVRLVRAIPMLATAVGAVALAAFGSVLWLLATGVL